MLKSRGAVYWPRVPQLGHGTSDRSSSVVSLPRALGVLLGQLVGAVALVAVGALDQRVVEGLEVAGRDPDLAREDHRRVEADDVLAAGDHRLPPLPLDVLLELDAQGAVVPRRPRAAVDLTRREDEPAALGQRDDGFDLGGRGFRGHGRHSTTKGWDEVSSVPAGPGNPRSRTPSLRHRTASSSTASPLRAFDRRRAVHVAASKRPTRRVETYDSPCRNARLTGGGVSAVGRPSPPRRGPRRARGCAWPAGTGRAGSRAAAPAPRRRPGSGAPGTLTARPRARSARQRSTTASGVEPHRRAAGRQARPLVVAGLHRARGDRDDPHTGADERRGHGVGEAQHPGLARGVGDSPRAAGSPRSSTG